MCWLPLGCVHGSLTTNPERIQKMSKKKASSSGSMVQVPQEQYSAMVETMKELAARNTGSEAIVLRCAKAGGVKEVVKHITWLRNYIKKHPRAQRAEAEDNGLPKSRGKKKRSSKRTPPPTHNTAETGERSATAEEL